MVSNSEKIRCGGFSRLKTFLRLWAEALILVVLSCMVASSVFASEVRDYSIRHAQNRYFDLPQNARSLGMGGSYAATSSDVSNVFGNPAGLGWLERWEIGVTYNDDDLNGEDYLQPRVPPCSPGFSELAEEMWNLHLQMAIPLKKNENGVIGLGISGGRSDVDDSVGTETHNLRLHAAYAKKLSEYWSLGYAFTYHDDEENTDFSNYEMEDGFTNKLGLQFKPDEKWTFGFSGFYSFADPEVQTGLFGNMEDDRESWGLDAGAAYRILDRTLLAASLDFTEYDLDWGEDGDSMRGHLGVEQGITSWLDTRLGYIYQDTDYRFHDSGILGKLSGETSFHSATAGLGIKLREGTTIDYSLVHRFVGQGEDSQTVTLTHRF